MVIDKECFKIKNLILNPLSAIREIKSIIQRAKNGYGYTDTFSLDIYFLKVFSKALKDFKKYNNGSPYELTYEEWNIIIQDMIDGFEEMEKAYWEWGDTSLAEKKYNKAMKLFVKWHRHLWW